MLTVSNPSPGKTESVGSINPELACYASFQNSSIGAGSACLASLQVLSAKFTGLEPEPQ